MDTHTASVRNLSCSLVVSVLLALVVAASASIQPAFAAVSSVSTPTAHAWYANPDTGEIEDSGGAANEALGTSMSQGITATSALLEKDSDGSVFVTIRLSQADQLGEVSIASDAGRSGSFGEAVAAQVMQQDTDANTADYRAKIASEDATLRISMYVAAMGRSVVYFVQLSDAVAGNTADFVQSIVAGQGSAEDASPAKAAASSGTEGTSQASSQKNADGAGIKEFDGEGNEVGGATSPLASPETYALVAGGVLAVGAAALAGYYMVRGRKRKALHDSAAAAAAGHDDTTAPPV